jgi:hypothetical protein
MHANCEYVLQGVPVNFKQPAQWFYSFFILGTLLIIPTRVCIVRKRLLVTGPIHGQYACAECNRSKLWRVFDSRSNEPSKYLPNKQRNCAVATDWTAQEDATNFLGDAFTKILGDIFNQYNAELNAFHRSN